MGTTADKLNRVLATKNDLKAALIEKGQDPGDVFSQYPAKVRAIKTDSIKLSSIAITKQPNKTTYSAFESFSSAGMEVKAVFTNDAYKLVSNYTVEPSGQLKATDTKVKVKYEEFGVTAEAEVAITVQTIAISIPSANESFTYTGSVLTPTWSNYDSSLMSISGNTSGTSAGTYSATFSLKDKVNYRWSDGSTSDKSVNWTIGKASVAIPTANSTSFTYNGSAATLSLSNYDSALISASGISATNAGNYTATFALKDSNNYQWSDGTTANKTIAWVINKAQASVTLDKTSVVLNADKPTDTVTFSSVGMKSIIAMSSDTNVATISVSGDVITISSVNETSGAASIVLSGEVDPNYNAPEYPSIAVEAVFAFPVSILIKSATDYNAQVVLSSIKATIGDTIYSSPGKYLTDISVLTGTVIRLEISNTARAYTATVNLNGEVASTESLTTADTFVYEYTIEDDLTIELVPGYNTGVVSISTGGVSYFYVDSVEYKMIGEMEWNEWLTTNWNTTGVTANTFGIYNSDGSFALLTDNIVSGARYTRCTDMIAVTITGTGKQQINYNSYGTGSYVKVLERALTDAGEYMVPAGITIQFVSVYFYGSSSSYGGHIYLNGIEVAGDSKTVTYDYVLTEPIEVKLSAAVGNNYGSIGVGGDLTAVESAKKRTLTITGTGNYSYCYIKVEGTRYYQAKEIVTAIGAPIYCYVSDRSDASSAGIWLNNSLVQSGETASYDYTVTEDVDFALSYSNNQGQIHITEK